MKARNHAFQFLLTHTALSQQLRLVADHREGSTPFTNDLSTSGVLDPRARANLMQLEVGRHVAAGGFGLVVAVAGRVQRVDWLGVDGGGAAVVGASGTHGDLVDRGGQAGAGFRAAPSVASWYLHSVWRQVRPGWRTSPIR